MLPSNWDRRAERARELARKYPVAADLLLFYQDLARLQKDVHRALTSSGLTSKEDPSLSFLLPFFPSLLDLVKKKGSGALAQAAEEWLRQDFEDKSRWEDLLVQAWHPDVDAPSLAPEELFFAHVLIQPYAEFMAGRHTPAADPAGAPSGSNCPFCGSKPQVAVLRPEGDGAKRSLICTLCGTEWLYRRVVCPNCGEEHKDRLPIFTTPEFDYVRIDACDTCHTYIKSIDLTKNGHAVPVVDELATVSLNLWALEHDYTKVAPNLFGI